jgi:folate-binding protein YgfZ
MQTECTSVALEALGVLRVRGADAVSFLQGQLSSDVAQLSSARSLLTGYHNPQGRVIALLRLVQAAPEDLLAVLPRELIGPVLQRLSKFVLRSKVKLSDESAEWTISGVVGAAAEAPGNTNLAWPQAVDAVARRDDTIAVRLAAEPARWLVLNPRALPARLPCTAAPPQLWQQLAIAAGEPQVYATTSEEFVAQMLNLDALGAIAFDKGCYTGQEVIARAHYRGRVKRRLQRFLCSRSLALQPGDSVVLADGRSVKVVDAVVLADGRCEFLAVATGTVAATDAAGATIEAQQLPLPYPLPP